MARYCDTSAIIQVIGNIYNNVGLLDYEDYHFCEDDFPEQFHKILFGSIFNLHALGAKEITLNAIEDYLTQRPTSYATYKTNKGHEYLEQICRSGRRSKLAAQMLSKKGYQVVELNTGFNSWKGEVSN